VAYVVAEPCVDVLDRACVEECPVEAVFYEDDLPEQYGPFAEANVVVFASVGSPGGASKVSALPDPAFVAALPPREA